MDIEEAIAGRRSCRQYSQQAVDEPTIRRLIDAAVLAPNAVNEQPWMFTVVRDQPLLDRLSQQAKLHMLSGLPAEERWSSLRRSPISPHSLRRSASVNRSPTSPAGPLSTGPHLLRTPPLSPPRSGQ